MTEAIPSTRPEFFGKDSFTPFIGRVEDVNDPKMSGRVKVRCIGWHPKSKKSGGDNGGDGLSTEDLPWARVGMPPTHPQQARVGGKHGLLNGCWVFGFFLDGSEAQDPMVLSTFNFTAKASDNDNRQVLKGTDGTDTQEDNAFSKNQNKEMSNSAVKTDKERGTGFSDQNDKAGDTTLNDADGKCAGKKPLQSKEAKTRQEEKNSKETPQAQDTDALKGDGMCGSIAHAQEDIQKKIQEFMPSELSRFSHGDAVWNRFSGNYMDMNGIYAQLAQMMCSSLKQPINSSKSFINETNRKTKATKLLGIPDRDGFIIQQAEKALSIKDDIFNGIFQKSFVDVLCSMMMKMLQAMNNDSNDSDGQNSESNIGSSRNTTITNTEARCISSTIIDNVKVMTDSALEMTNKAAEENSESESNSEDLMGQIGEIIGALSSVMQFPMMQKYASRPDVFNAAGTASQDALTKDGGCSPERVYNTAMGSLGSLMGVGAGSGQGSDGVGGGGSGQGSNSNRGVDRFIGVGFGGRKEEEGEEIEMTNQLCDEAKTVYYKDGEQRPVLIQTQNGLTTDLELGESIWQRRDENGEFLTGGIVINGTPGNIVDNTGDFTDKVLKRPAGERGEGIAISLPSSNKECAKNFINGTPNQIVITRHGEKYFFDNIRVAEKAFPSIYIKDYIGTPVPVVDRESGELVAVLTNCESFNPNKPNTQVSIIPDNSEVGITTDDPSYTVSLGGFFIANTGFDYCNPRVEIIDRDKNIVAAEAVLTVVQGRIVDYDIINTGSGFKRIPEVRIIDDGFECGTKGGIKAKLYPIMSVIPTHESPKPLPFPVQMSYCPSHQLNLY